MPLHLRGTVAEAAVKAVLEQTFPPRLVLDTPKLTEEDWAKALAEFDNTGRFVVMPPVRMAGDADRIEALEGLLASIELYIDWRYITRQLTTEQKELLADAIEAASARTHAADPVGAPEPRTVERWWRDDNRKDATR